MDWLLYPFAAIGLLTVLKWFFLMWTGHERGRRLREIDAETATRRDAGDE